MPPDEVTVTLKGADMLLPGFGLLTTTAKLPAVFAEPVAVSVVDETKVVLAEAPPNSACAPLTKFVPVIVSA